MTQHLHPAAATTASPEVARAPGAVSQLHLGWQQHPRHPLRLEWGIRVPRQHCIRPPAPHVHLRACRSLRKLEPAVAACVFVLVWLEAGVSATEGEGVTGQVLERALNLAWAMLPAGLCAILQANHDGTMLRVRLGDA
jgi:hypothetical protein